MKIYNQSYNIIFFYINYYDVLYFSKNYIFFYKLIHYNIINV